MQSKWVVCILLFLATTLNYLDRQVLSILAPLLQKDMGLTNVQLGALFSAFYYSYTFSQFAAGWFLDRVHMRWAFGAAVLGWSLVCALTGLAHTFTALLLFRLLLGVAESANWPGALRIISRALPPADRALGSGIFTSGTSVGALIAPALVLGISAAFGWRWAFVVVGSFGLIWFLLWIAMTGGQNWAAVWKAATDAPARSGGYWAILRMSRFWQVWLVAILVNPCLYFSVNWLPTYFVQERGLSPDRQLGVVLTVIYIGLDAGYLIGGGGASWLARRGWRIGRAQRVVFLAATGFMMCFAAVPILPQVNAAVAALAIANVGVGMWISTYLTLAQSVAPERVATATGMLGGSGSLAGAWAMTAVGALTARTGSFTFPFAAVAAAVIAAAAAGWIATRPQPVVAEPSQRFRAAR